jgi:large subunit ribosomal protein L29
MSKVSITLDELRDQPDDELVQALARTRDELFRLRLGQHTNQVTSTAALRTKRRDIARILTILRGRGLGIETQAQKQASTPAEAGTETQTQTTKKAKS